MTGRVFPRGASAVALGALRRLRRWLLGACLGAGIIAAGAHSTDVESVYQAYVLNFVRYSHWPDSDTGSADYVIAVVGPSSTAAALRQLAARNGPVQGHALRVRSITVNSLAPQRAEAVRTLKDSLDDARVVYVASSHRSWSGAVIAATAGKPVLTIGVGGDFVRKGGMLGLFNRQGRVNFSANETAVSQSSVDVSARVLVLARPAPGADVDED